VRGAENNVYEPPLEFQIGRGDGTILARSANAPNLPVLGVPDYSDIIRPTGSWRVLNVASADGRYRVQVSQSIALRDIAALEVAERTILPLALISPILILLIYFSTRWPTMSRCATRRTSRRSTKSRYRRKPGRWSPRSTACWRDWAVRSKTSGASRPTPPMNCARRWRR
jgi:hypothetical protein